MPNNKQTQTTQNTYEIQQVKDDQDWFLGVIFLTAVIKAQLAAGFKSAGKEKPPF